MSVRVHAVGRPDVSPLVMPERFRHEIIYFAADHPPPGETLGADEWWIDAAEAEAWLADGVVQLVSPLDRGSTAEIEVTEEQESWLEWVVRHGVRRVRFE